MSYSWGKSTGSHLPLVFWQWDRGRLPGRCARSPTGLRHERRRCSQRCPRSPPDAALQCLLGPDLLPTLSHLAQTQSTWIKASQAGTHVSDLPASASALTAGLEAAGGAREVVDWFLVCDDDYSTGDPRPSPGRGTQEVLCGEFHRFTCRGRHKGNLKQRLWAERA